MRIVYLLAVIIAVLVSFPALSFKEGDPVFHVYIGRSGDSIVKFRAERVKYSKSFEINKGRSEKESDTKIELIDEKRKVVDSSYVVFSESLSGRVGEFFGIDREKLAALPKSTASLFFSDNKEVQKIILSMKKVKREILVKELK